VAVTSQSFVHEGDIYVCCRNQQIVTPAGVFVGEAASTDLGAV
jgi:hypothetical protein